MSTSITIYLFNFYVVVDYLFEHTVAYVISDSKINYTAYIIRLY